jgi:hypothetical protein
MKPSFHPLSSHRCSSAIATCRGLKLFIAYTVTFQTPFRGPETPRAIAIQGPKWFVYAPRAERILLLLEDTVLIEALLKFVDFPKRGLKGRSGEPNIV